MCARVNNEKKEKDRWKKGDAGELEMENIRGKVVEDKFKIIGNYRAIMERSKKKVGREM
jgi:hypothetical protein